MVCKAYHPGDIRKLRFATTLYPWSMDHARNAPFTERACVTLHAVFAAVVEGGGASNREADAALCMPSASIDADDSGAGTADARAADARPAEVCAAAGAAGDCAAVAPAAGNRSAVVCTNSSCEARATWCGDTTCAASSGYSSRGAHPTSPSSREPLSQ